MKTLNPKLPLLAVLLSSSLLAGCATDAALANAINKENERKQQIHDGRSRVNESGSNTFNHDRGIIESSSIAMNEPAQAAQSLPEPNFDESLPTGIQTWRGGYNIHDFNSDIRVRVNFDNRVITGDNYHARILLSYPKETRIVTGSLTIKQHPTYKGDYNISGFIEPENIKTTISHNGNDVGSFNATPY